MFLCVTADDAERVASGSNNGTTVLGLLFSRFVCLPKAGVGQGPPDMLFWKGGAGGGVALDQPAPAASVPRTTDDDMREGPWGLAWLGSRPDPARCGSTEGCRWMDLANTARVQGKGSRKGGAGNSEVCRWMSPAGLAQTERAQWILPGWSG